MAANPVIESDAPPQFCIAGANGNRIGSGDSALWRLAAQAGWETRYVDACASDEMDETVALVELKGVGVTAPGDCFRTRSSSALVMTREPTW